MAGIQAYLDDFNSVQVVANRNYFNGSTGGFYITKEDGCVIDCVLSGVEEHEHDIRYNLTTSQEIELGHLYMMHDNHGQMVAVKGRFVAQSPRFNRLYSYEGDDLGAIYHPGFTDFALWSPTSQRVFIRLTDSSGTVTMHEMHRSGRGVWRLHLSGDHRHDLYRYVIERDGETIETLDPYSLSSTANGRDSAVIDVSEILSIPDYEVKERIGANTDAIIYEASIRDMTSSELTGTKTHGKYVSLTESGTSFKGNPTGLDYLASLGVTHVQFQPVADFQTVDEQHPERGYNWGYDGMQLLALEGSYSTDPDDPYARMKEFRQMVAALHRKGLRVNIDVVFNHMYDAEQTSLDKTVPHYFFRFSDNGYYSNGSGCGNDLESRQPMMRRYFLHVITTWMKLYGVDGFRFDLMGILDVDTMNMILHAAKSIKPDAMIYGEGWDMPTALDDSLKAKIYNQRRMPGIGHFNDTFRDVCKGRTGHNDLYDRGYLTGSIEKAFDMCSVLSGNTLSSPYFQRFDQPVQSVNGVETHDNATAWDKMHACCGNEPREIRKKRQKMMIAASLLAQGIPFIHAGLEFCGTKNDNDNSYNAGDTINQMNWDRLSYNLDVYEYTKKAIRLRKSFQEFRMSDATLIEQYCSFRVVDDCTVFYDINYFNPMRHSDGLRIIFNPTMENRHYWFESTWNILLDENGDSHSEEGHEFDVPPCSVLVLRKTRKH